MGSDVSSEPSIHQPEGTVPERLPSRSEVDDFANFVRYASSTTNGSDAPLALRRWMDLAEIWRITQALRECGGNRSAAARALGIGRRTLYAKMEKLGISPTWTP